MKINLTALIIVTVSTIGAAAMVINKQPPAARSELESVVLVNTIDAKSVDVTFAIESQGTVQPRTETTLVTEVAGLVISVSQKFVVGGFFNKGEVLLTLDPIDYEVAVEQSRANLLTAQARLSRESAMAEQAAKEWDMTGKSRDKAPVLALRTPYIKEARAGLLYAQADLKRAERKLERTIIRAPYTGLVREKLVDVGQFMGMGAQIAKTFAVDFAEIRLPLSNNDIEFLNLPRPGHSESIATNKLYLNGTQVNDGDGVHHNKNSNQVTLYSTIGSKQFEWQGRIVRTEGVIDNNTRMRYAIAQLIDPYNLKQLTLKPPLAMGSFVNASLQGVSVKNVFTIPQNVLHEGNRVLVMDDTQRLKIRNVDVIRSDNKYSWVSGELSNGDDIITTALEVPVEGMKLALFSDDL